MQNNKLLAVYNAALAVNRASYEDGDEIVFVRRPEFEALGKAVAACFGMENTPDENTLPLESLPEGCKASVYAPIAVQGDMWASCVFKGSHAYRMGYGASPRTAMLAAISMVRE